MNPEDEPDYIEITREVWTECDAYNADGDQCDYSRIEELDGIQVNGMEYFEWTCTECGTGHSMEWEADLDE